MNDDFSREEAVFHAASEIRNPGEREAFILRECGSDLEMRERVEALFQVAGVERDFLEDPAPGVPDAGAKAEPGRQEVAGPEQPGDRIRNYKLIERIGEGGCGIVYLAEQEEPLRRFVALKIVKLGMDTRDVIARFEAERQALALMEHPNIAKVLDAGATYSGRPYFVMELVRGKKITDYCEQERLPPRARLELFNKVCQAIQHAHQKGIIHRDIKPSNVLVTLHDGEAVPKVIDFGIAKATGEQRLTDRTLFTVFHQFIGTPAYMSPEQADTSGVDIDTRSDIYSLGVLLYEVLTGQTPFDPGELQAAGLDAMLRTIREKVPPKPSTRLSTILSADTKGLPVHRELERARLIHLVRGDLDWIVMKCLEKDRNRRYATANGLAADVQRYLNREPVVARPPSRLYALRKLAARNKGTFVAVSAVGLALVAGLTASTCLYMQQSKLQRSATREAEHARVAEADARDKLRESYFAQAQALRWSEHPGRRFEALKLLKKAAEIKPSLELRNEAIACMVLTDIRERQEVEACPPGGIGGYLDRTYSRYVSADAEGRIHVRTTHTGEETVAFPGFEHPFHTFEFSPDGRFLFVAWGPMRHNMGLLDLERGEIWLRPPDGEFRAMAFSADSQLLAVAYNESQYPIRLFDVTTKKECGSFEHGTLPYYLRFHPREKQLLLTSDRKSEAQVWNWQTKQVVRTFSHPNWVQGICWSPGGTGLATACADSKVRIWDFATGAQQAEFDGHEAAAVEVTFSRDEHYLASQGWDGRACIFDVAARRPMLHLPAPAFMANFAADANRFALFTSERRFTIYEVVEGCGYRVLRTGPPGEETHSCDFSPSGRTLVSTHPNKVRLWDVSAGKETWKVDSPLEQHFAVFTLKGTNVLSLSGEGLAFWPFAEGSSDAVPLKPWKEVRVPQVRSAIWTLADGRIAVAASDALHFFDGKGEEFAPFYLPEPAELFALDHRGKRVATWVRASTKVSIWEVATSNLVQTLPAHLSIYATFSPDDRWLAVGDGEEISWWDTERWERAHTVPRKAAGFWGYLAFSPDGRMLAVAISRFSVQLLDTRTGRELATLTSPERIDVGDLKFTRDGMGLAVVSRTGPVQIWDLAAIRAALASVKLDWDLSD